MLIATHRTRIGHHRRLNHPGQSVRRVPIEHVTGFVAVPVREHIPAPAAKQPEWLTEAWKHRVEAEALHHLEHRLRGLGSVR